jgi:hypothetical protein
MLLDIGNKNGQQLINGLQPLKNNLPYKSIEMGFNPFIKTTSITYFYCIKFLVFLSISLNALAQCDEKGFIANATIGDIGKPEIGSYYLPAYKEVAIYSAPSTKSKASYKTKSFKDSLKVLEILNTQVVLKRVYGYWCKVSFPFNGKRFIGYVPSQFLATNYLNYTNMRYLLLVNCIVS